MKKGPHCSTCGGDTHYALRCFNAPRKAIKRAPVALKQRKRKTTQVKKITRTQAKKKAWAAFSTYIRVRDCIATTGTTTAGTCITCVERGDTLPKPYAKLQAGHAVGGRGNAVLFHERLVNAQCGYCNSKPPMGLGGDYGNYALALTRTYGIEQVAQWQRLRHDSTVKYSISDLVEIAERYTRLTAELLKK